MEDEIEEIILDKSEIVAFFQDKNTRLKPEENFEIKPFLQSPGHVAWEVRGKGLMKCLQDIFNNVPIPINSYLRALKEVRSQIYIFQDIGFKGNKKKTLEQITRRSL